MMIWRGVDPKVLAEILIRAAASVRAHLVTASGRGSSETHLSASEQRVALARNPERDDNG